MGLFLAVLFMCFVVAMGMGAIKSLVIPGSKAHVVKSRTVHMRLKDKDIPKDVKVMLLALENEAATLASEEGIHYIHDPILTEMIEKVDSHHELVWIAPLVGMRVKHMPDDAPSVLRDSYNMILITSKVVIGFNSKRR